MWGPWWARARRATTAARLPPALSPATITRHPYLTPGDLVLDVLHRPLQRRPRVVGSRREAAVLRRQPVVDHHHRAVRPPGELASDGVEVVERADHPATPVVVDDHPGGPVPGAAASRARTRPTTDPASPTTPSPAPSPIRRAASPSSRGPLPGSARAAARPRSRPAAQAAGRRVVERHRPPLFCRGCVRARSKPS